MLKLPLLQPSFTADDGRTHVTVDNDRHSSWTRQNDTSPDANHTMWLEAKGWEEQAQEVTKHLSSSSKFKSIAVHAEVKLAEALERCTQMNAASTKDQTVRPNKLRTAVCCQLLGDFADLCGPFTHVLKTLRNELAAAVYSDYFTSEKGRLVFDQIPWFSVAERLEQDKDHMAHEREMFKKELDDRKADLARVELSLNSFKRAVEASEAQVSGLKAQVDNLRRAGEAAQIETKTAREELKKLRKELMRSRDECEDVKAQMAKLKEDTTRAEEKMQSRMADLKKELQNTHQELLEARAIADNYISVDQVEDIKRRMETAESAVELLQLTVQEKQYEIDMAKSKMEAMTPRPNWKTMQLPSSFAEVKRTAEIVTRLVKAARERDVLAHQLQVSLAMSDWDTAPHPWKLDITAESSAYFITEKDGSTTKSTETAAPLGLATDVPRFLRWDERVPILPMDMKQALDLIHAVWQAKTTREQHGAREPLHTFLHAYLMTKSRKMEEAVQQAYSLLYFCQETNHINSRVRLFYKVLTGQLPEAIYHEWQNTLECVRQTCHAASRPMLGHEYDDSVLLESISAEGRVVQKEHLLSAFIKLLPRQDTLQLTRLQTAISSLSRTKEVELTKLLEHFENSAFGGTVPYGSSSDGDYEDMMNPHLPVQEMLLQQYVMDVEAAVGHLMHTLNDLEKDHGTEAVSLSVLRKVLMTQAPPSQPQLVNKVLSEALNYHSTTLLEPMMQTKKLTAAACIETLQKRVLFSPWVVDLAAALQHCRDLVTEPVVTEPELDRTAA